MTRSLKKGPFVAQHLLNQIEYLIKKNEKKTILTYSRSSTIVPIIIGYTIAVHNGLEHSPILITDQIIGHKLGEFSFTRVSCSHVKSDKKFKRLIFLLWDKKTHPLGLRLGINQRSSSQWYAKGFEYSFFVREDLYLRNCIYREHQYCIISEIIIERRGINIRFNISAAHIKYLVGPKGKILKKLCSTLQNQCESFRHNYLKLFNTKINLTEKPKIQVYVRQVVQPDENAKCLASSIVIELEKRSPFRRVLRMAQERTKNINRVRGVRLQISGRLNGAEIARMEWTRSGCVSLHTLSAKIDYAYLIARTIYGLLGVKVWIFYLPPFFRRVLS
jgi:small subunit ribosomal protein S3